MPADTAAPTDEGMDSCDKYGFPYAKTMPMVALVIGAASPIGQRIAATLAINGSRLALVDDNRERDTLEKIGRLATCVGCPSCDVHEVDLSSSGKKTNGPPEETFQQVIETIMSRQGTVDIVISCPRGVNVKEWQQQSGQQFNAATALTSQLAAPALLAYNPPNKAVITVVTDSNSDMIDWSKDIVEYLTKEGADDRTGITGPSAQGLTEQQRRDIAKQLALLRVVVKEGSGEDGSGHIPKDLPKRISSKVLDFLVAWQQTQRTSSSQTPQPAVHRDVTVSFTAAAAAAAGTLTTAATEQGGLTGGEGPGYAVPENKGPLGLVKGVAEKGRDLVTQALSPMGASEDTGKSTGTAAAAASGMDSYLAVAAAAKPIEHKLVMAAAERGGGTSGVLLSTDEEEVLLQHTRFLLGYAEPAAGAAGGSTAGAGISGSTLDAEAAKVTGRDPSPHQGATCRANPIKATWIKSMKPPLTGMILSTGSRTAAGLLTRPRHGVEELVKAANALPGVVLTPADPNNLEPEAGRAYKDDPSRHPSYLVQCAKPFNGETPHQLLADKFLTPSELFYVRNHLPVPTDLKAEGYEFELSGPGIKGPLKIRLEDLKQGKWGPVIRRQATLQCAGNRRAEDAAVKLVEGRAPWNHGSIGTAEWTGVQLRGLLERAGLDVAGQTYPGTSPYASLHLVMEAWDFHHEDTKVHFSTSIPLHKVLNPAGEVMLAWEMNRKPLLPDHGYPLRAIVPGYVGTRSVKWLKTISISSQECQSAWQKKDYKLFPHKFTSLGNSDPHSMPPIMAMNTQSAILLPEPGSIIDAASTDSVWFKGYAWCGGGLPITRVDVSADEGQTWDLADIVERETDFVGQEELDGASQATGTPTSKVLGAIEQSITTVTSSLKHKTVGESSAPVGGQERGPLAWHGDGASGQAWSWIKWQIPLQIPEHLLEHGGKWRVCCKAWNINGDTQPSAVGAVWNFRGLACNAWHFVDLAILPRNKPQTT